MLPFIERLIPEALSAVYNNTCQYFLTDSREETPGSQRTGPLMLHF